MEDKYVVIEDKKTLLYGDGRMEVYDSSRFPGCNDLILKGAGGRRFSFPVGVLSNLADTPPEDFIKRVGEVDPDLIKCVRELNVPPAWLQDALSKADSQEKERIAAA